MHNCVTNVLYINFTMNEETKLAAPQEQFEENVTNVTNETLENQVVQDKYQDLSGKSLKEIVSAFETLMEGGDHAEMYKYADQIKSIFYISLRKERIAAGYVVPAANDSLEVEESSEVVASSDPFAEIERGFKDLYEKYKEIKSQYKSQLEKQKEENYEVKIGIIEELKELLETQEDLINTFPKFKEIQTRWRESGPVPQARVKDIYESYQHYVEKFYDYVKINNELRDLDFKKNYEAKIALCEKAEKLISESNVVQAFATLQKLHEEWKELGPVDKKFRDEIWDRFKAATSQINKNHQSFFEKIKVEQKANLAAKTLICEKAEEIASREVKDSNTWNEYSKEIEALQKEWKGIGFASKKDNQKIYDRFRAACDIFYGRKRDYYSQFKDQMTKNLEQKIALCEKAEALKESTDWKKTSDELINLQKQWKEIGPISRKKSDQVWARFRAACDYFFDNKEKNFGGIDPKYIENLNQKLALIEEIKNYDSSEGDSMAAMRDFMNRWNEIGFVPFKEKDKVQASYKEAMDAAFPGSGRGAKGGARKSRAKDSTNKERERLILKFRKKESEIATYENNIGFFASSKNADSLIKELKKKIEAAKAELVELEEKINSIEDSIE